MYVLCYLSVSWVTSVYWLSLRFEYVLYRYFYNPRNNYLFLSFLIFVFPVFYINNLQLKPELLLFPLPSSIFIDFTLVT